jgi:TrmH family RNA methyltransferase
MISKNKIKQIKSLSLKKIRQKESLFLVEGDKNVSEALDSEYVVKEVYATAKFLRNNEKKVIRVPSVYVVSSEEIKKISLLSQPQNALALCSIPPAGDIVPRLNSFCLYLDDIQDPGNMGTIIRICDWFGIEMLFCSPSTVDLYNPKVIQASMGSFCRVKTVYIPFTDLLNKSVETNFPVFGTFPEGKNIYEENLPEQGLVIMGNEGRGISKEVEKKIDHRLSIPSFSGGKNRAESLNVAIAAGIICSEFKRKAFSLPIQNESKE